MIRTGVELQFSYMDDTSLVYMIIDVDSTSVINKVYANYLRPGTTVTSRMVWQAALAAPVMPRQILLAHGSAIADRSYSTRVSFITIVFEGYNCIGNLDETSPSTLATWTTYTVSTAQTNFVIGHDITVKPQDTSFVVADGVPNADYTVPCEIELELKVDSSKSFYEHDSQSFRILEQCKEISNCGSSLNPTQT